MISLQQGKIKASHLHISTISWTGRPIIRWESS